MYSTFRVEDGVRVRVGRGCHGSGRPAEGPVEVVPVWGPGVPTTDLLSNRRTLQGSTVLFRYTLPKRLLLSCRGDVPTGTVLSTGDPEGRGWDRYVPRTVRLESSEEFLVIRTESRIARPDYLPPRTTPGLERCLRCVVKSTHTLSSNLWVRPVRIDLAFIENPLRLEEKCRVGREEGIYILSTNIVHTPTCPSVDTGDTVSGVSVSRGPFEVGLVSDDRVGSEGRPVGSFAHPLGHWSLGLYTGISTKSLTSHFRTSLL